MSAEGRVLSFIYFDRTEKRNKRIGFKEGWPSNIYDLEEAKKEKQRFIGKIDGAFTAAAKRLETINKFGDPQQRMEAYAAWVEVRSPNTASYYMSNLKNYVFPYFYGELSEPNFENWRRNYLEFTKWLLESKPVKISSSLSRNTINNIINSLNSFLSFLEEKEALGPFVRCKKVSVGKKEKRGLDEIYTDEEVGRLVKAVREVKPIYGTLVLLLAQSGMRVNEALGLHFQSISFGKIAPQKKFIFSRMQQAGYDIYGYILLTDQPALDGLFDSKGHVPRKPLKGRKEIAPQYNRYIPLISEGLATELSELANLREKGKPKGQAVEDTLLFGFSYSEFYRDFLKIRANLRLNKDIHSLRHSFATSLARRCGGDTSIAVNVLGHSRAEITERYVHLAEELEHQRSQTRNPDRVVKKVVFE